MARFRRIVVVTKKTQFQELLERFVTEAQARFYLEHMGLPFEPYAEAHGAYMGALERLMASLPPSPRHQVIDRTFLPTFIFGEGDLVVTLGGNGLVVNTAKYAAGKPILAVNPDPARHEAILVPFRVGEVRQYLGSILRGESRSRSVTMALASLNDGQRLLGFNDLFIGHRTHVSARYEVEFDGQTEYQSSSGIIVATGAGSTGWMRSVVTGSLGVVQSLCPQVEDLPTSLDPQFDWAADRLTFAVREPFPGKTSRAGLVLGMIERKRPLRITSYMPEGGVIFSDGVLEDAVTFNSGSIAEITLAERKAVLIAP